jgi:fucose 4-O-acetylase-like acetyltransferase
MQLREGDNRNSFEWVLIAKGIGIILVVVGHFYPQTSPTYWIEIRRIIYSFHMPLFFILSGYLYSHGKYPYNDLIKTKAKRLLYPFVTIAGTFFLIKYMAGQVVDLEYPVNIDSLYTLLTDPVNSFMPLLWFIHALFLMFAVYPLARLFLNNLSILLLLLAMNIFLGNDYLVFGKALANMPFFATGVMLRENRTLSKMTISADWPYVFAPLMIFFLSYMMRLSVNIEPGYGHPIQFFLGVVGSLFVINISHAISALSDVKMKEVLTQVGYYSMGIYLFHTLFESTVRIGFLQVFKQMQAPFELIAFVAITCGIVFPLVLEKKVLRKYWVTRKFVLGLS